MKNTDILKLSNVSKSFTLDGRAIAVLNNVSLAIPSMSSVSFVGPSGSGKTTLLSLCAGLDRPSSGSIYFNGNDLSSLNEEELAELRNKHIGFIFQTFQLIPSLTAIENVMVPLELQGNINPRRPALELLERIGLGHRINHYPVQLSGGEQQRVSIARAFINKPKVLFADEPTGNLDEDTSKAVEEQIFSLNKETGTTLILVTHNQRLAQRTTYRYRIEHGNCTLQS
jgi:putative ABC transport system ATP-binding protein